MKKGKVSISCIGALTIPDSKSESLFREFAELKKKWGLCCAPKRGELNESQISSTVALLLKYDAYLHVVATDTGFTDKAEIEKYKEAQIRGLQKNITELHKPELCSQLRLMCEEIQSLSFPNYIQYSLLTDLLDRIYRDMTLWYATHEASELGDFRWVLDSKNDQPTKAERIWKTLVAGYLEFRSLSEPLICLEGADYSYLDRYLVDVSEHLVPHLKEKNKNNGGYDIKKIICDNIEFADDKDCSGLQLSHIVCNAYRRALIGNIEISEISSIGQLMMKSRKFAVILRMFRTDGVEEAYLERGVEERLLVLEHEASKRIKIRS